MRAWLSRIADLFLRRGRDARLDDGVRTHVELLTDEFIAKGMTLEDARLAARRQFGGVDQVKERYPRSTRLAAARLADGGRPLRVPPDAQERAVLHPPPDRSRSASTRRRWRSQR
jgi:hypothetical protein